MSGDWFGDDFRPRKGGMTRYQMHVAVAETTLTKLAWAIAALGRTIIWVKAQ